LYWPGFYRYLTRLSAPLSELERLRTERVLGFARAMLALVLLLGVYVDTGSRGEATRLIYLTLTPWLAYACGLLGWLYWHETPPPAWLLHGIDLLWILLITTLVQAGPMIALSTFSLLAAGFRWGFPETLATAIIDCLIIALEARLFGTTTSSYHDVLLNPYEVNRLIVRCAFTLVIGLLIGMVAENTKEGRAESAMLNRMLHAVRPEAGLANSLQIVLAEFMRLYSAQRAYVIVKELLTDRILVWQLEASPSPDPTPRVREIPAGDGSLYLLPELPATAYCYTNLDGVNMLSLEAGTLKAERLAAMPQLELMRGSPRSMLCVGSEMGNGWMARLVLLEARLGPRHERELRFAESLARQATSALYSVFLIRRLRSRAGAMERARVARELHDGAIQSLISAEMRVDVLRRQAERGRSQITAGELEELQHLLRNEVLNLRELMQQMRPVDLTPEQLLDYVAETVERFRRDTGIEASFISGLQEVNLSPHVCRELVRIVQEGLVNIRKHAQATHAVVNITLGAGGALALTISDNGRGFDFEGQMAPEELNSTSKGPTIIKERVRGIGGRLSIESMPGRGSRLEITLPPKGNSVHG
jgi:signal transduction histidine kinase